MQSLRCEACDTEVPLNPPRMVAGNWQTMCGECLAEHRLMQVGGNVFLPLRFRVVHAVVSVPRPEMTLWPVGPAD